jgi:alpha-beta hydrolase superfamily lysophospholipase
MSRYDELARRWTELGAFVVGPDHRGQGRSDGPKGHIESFTVYASDALEVLRGAQDEHGLTDIPWFVFGHSMGGLVALTLLLDYARTPAGPLRGAVISAPLLGVAMKVSLFKRVLARIADRVAPKLALPTGMPSEYISRDPEQVRIYDEDRRRVTLVSARWASAMDVAIERVEQEVSKLTLPMLWYAGTGDKVCSFDATRAAFDGLEDAAANDQSFRRLEGYYHEPHNEPEDLRAPVLEMVEEWFTARLSADDA